MLRGTTGRARRFLVAARAPSSLSFSHWTLLSYTALCVPAGRPGAPLAVAWQLSALLARSHVTLKHPLPDWSGRSPVASPNFRCKHSNPHLVRRPCRPSPSPHLPSLKPAASGRSLPPQPAPRPSLQRSLLTRRSSRSTVGWVPFRHNIYPS